PGDRPLAGDAERPDPVVVPVAVERDIVVLVFMASREGLVAQLTLDIYAFGRGLEKAEIEQQRWIDDTLCHRDDRRARIERGEPGLEPPPRGGLGKISLGQQQPVRHCCLLYRFWLPVERTAAIDRIDC